MTANLETNTEKGDAGSVRTIGAPVNFWRDLVGRLREILRYRQVLSNLIRKELKVRYRNSALGFMWSMVNPLLYLAVFYVVFRYFLPGTIPTFHVYLLAGLLPWTLFSGALFQATGSVVGNADLVKKVYFPRELLPLSAIGAGLVHFFFQFLVLVGFLVVTRYEFTGAASLLVLPAVAAEMIFLAGLGLLLCAVNVRARDMQHLLELALLAWFWMTPIVYSSADTAARLADKSFAGINLIWFYLANPMTRLVLAFQRGIYGAAAPVVDGEPKPVVIDAPVSWFLEGVGYTALAGLLLLILGWWVFRKLDANFAEEL